MSILFVERQSYLKPKDHLETFIHAFVKQQHFFFFKLKITTDLPAAWTKGNLYLAYLFSYMKINKLTIEWAFSNNIQNSFLQYKV